MTKACYERGVLAIYANNDRRVCQLLPPLTIEKSVAVEILEDIDQALKDTADFLGLK
jgi:4-aminobutyrate aminotransferase-like enzyme